MISLTISLSDDKLHQLQEIAQERGITTEELLQTKINEWLTLNSDDFNKVTNYVLTKNAELYNRLA
ncbi:MAG: DNA-binding protein [Crocosphaera sp.]|nr:DNA-binding protein [Crocosphaera sp.]